MLTNSGAGLRGAVLAMAAVGFIVLASGQVQAQASSECAAAGPMMQERGKMMQRVQAFQKKRPTPVEACAAFGALVGNGNKLIPWVETNGSWCHVPAEFLGNLKTQHDQLTKVRAQACTAAAQQKKMMEQAKRAQQQGGAARGPMGGGDEIVGGPIRMPQGAL